MASALLVFALFAGDLAGAEKALAAGDATRALELLGDLADSDDASVAALVVLGRSYLALDNAEAAVDPLLRASDARPDDRALARDAASACRRSARGVYARAYLEDALRYARRAKEPRLVADLQFELGSYDDALAGYRSLDARDLAIHERIARCLIGLGRADEAKSAYAEALEAAIAKRDLLAAYRNAFAAGRGGRLLAWLDKEVAGNPEYVWFRLYRGYARVRMLMYPEAIVDLRFAVEKRPEDRAARMQLCVALMGQGAAEQRDELIREGETLARALLREDPSHQGAWEQLRWVAWHAWMNREVQRSCDVLRFLIDFDPEARDVGLNYCAMARRLGLHDEAETVFKRLLEAFPDDAALLNDYAILRDARGDRPGARRLWQRVLEVEETNLNALENLLTDAWERGDRERVARLLDRGEAAARAADGGPVARWQWFRDRLRWAPAGFGDR